VTLEYVGNIAHVKTLSKICILQLRGWLQLVWDEGVWVVSFLLWELKKLFVIQLKLEMIMEGSFQG